MKKKIVYIAHPIGGNVESNIERVKAIYKQLSLENEVIPFAPYIVAVESLNDADAKQRAIGFEHNEAIFKSGIIDELWVYGLSKGVLLEIEWAKELGIKIVMK